MTLLITQLATHGMNMKALEALRGACPMCLEVGYAVVIIMSLSSGSLNSGLNYARPSAFLFMRFEARMSDPIGKHSVDA